MKTKVKVIGSGSIGNHLTQASRRMGWEVCVVDADPKALERMKNEIYPQRYGKCDESIELYTPDKEPKGNFDIIMIGTPPDVRMKLALEALKENPKLLHLEKPLCTPDMKGVLEFNEELKKHPGTIVVVGYDNAVGSALVELAGMLEKKTFGEILTLDVEVREHWRGIFSAHPWLAGPWETYLGYWKRGGGAGGEHSHALHLWKYLADISGFGGITDVKSFFDFKKWARAQGSNGFIEWVGNASPEGDLLRYQIEGSEMVEKMVAKKRPDDFYCETLHYKDLLDGKIKLEDSPLSLDRGLEVMKIISEGYKVAEK